MRTADVEPAAYRRPVARLREGELARRAGAHAMIDVSDGLALDLHRLADASGVGFALDDVPVAEGATPEEALGGGEDYELVIAAAPATVDALCADFEDAGLRTPQPDRRHRRRSLGAAAARRAVGAPRLAAPRGLAAGSGSRRAPPGGSGRTAVGNVAKMCALSVGTPSALVAKPPRRDNELFED